MKKIFCLVVLLLLSSLCFGKSTISNYQRIFVPVFTTDGTLLLALRMFKMNHEPAFLTVDPNSLQTQVHPIAQLKSRNLVHKEKPGYFPSWNITSTRYYQLVNKHTSAPYVLNNQGVHRVEHTGNGNVLSIDLCPSSKPFETEFFNRLVLLAEKNKKPVSIAIAASGMWLVQHPEEFQWLLAQEKEKKLNITWVNHSFSHVYYHNLPYSQNFLLRPETNIDEEILLTEQYLLEAGAMPSVFFRFPGLVSNKDLMKNMRLYGLIPLGTNAWMANLQERHETVTTGGVILVHGNSNEHAGITAILPLLDQLNWVDIKEAL